MFILRFIGRILSIGFILFLAYLITGTNAKAELLFSVAHAGADRVVFERPYSNGL